MTREEQDQRDAIRRARMAKAAQPWVDEWCAFERDKTLAKFRGDDGLADTPVRAITYQQSLIAIERIGMSCAQAIESVRGDTDE